MPCRQCFTRRKHYATHTLAHTLPSRIKFSLTYLRDVALAGAFTHAQHHMCVTQSSARQAPGRGHICVSRSFYILFSLTPSLSKFADRSANLDEPDRPVRRQTRDNTKYCDVAALKVRPIHTSTQHYSDGEVCKNRLHVDYSKPLGEPESVPLPIAGRPHLGAAAGRQRVATCSATSFLLGALQAAQLPPKY